MPRIRKIFLSVKHFFIEPRRTRRRYVFEWLAEEIDEYRSACVTFQECNTPNCLLAVKLEALDILGLLFFIDLDEEPSDAFELSLLMNSAIILTDCYLSVDMVRAWSLYQKTRLRDVSDAQLCWMSDFVCKAEKLHHDCNLHVEVCDDYN